MVLKALGLRGQKGQGRISAPVLNSVSDPATLNKTGVLPQESYSHLGKKRRHIMT